MSEERPKLRPLDLVPVRAGGRQAFLLRDPQRLSSAEMAVPADIAFLLGQLDGTRTVREAQLSYVRRFGTLLTTERISDLLKRLDEALLLESDRYREARARIEAEFRARATRPAAHAGQSYEEAAGTFTLAWEARLAQASAPADFTLDAQRPALVAPHYDMKAASECYAAAYRLLAGTERPDVVVILGIAHSNGTAPFALTRKAFETPFGALETDPHIVDRLAEVAPFDLFADEFLHRDEHSIEFQAALLHFLYRDQAEVPRIVPVLCGGYHRAGEALADPATLEPVSRFLDSLRHLLAADPRRIGIIASADLSHIGARFGQRAVTQAHLELTRRHDMALLERAQVGDAQGLYQALAEAQDRYNVCGFPAIYALLRILPITEGRLLAYRQSVEPQTQSCVSFASVGLRSQGWQPGMPRSQHRTAGTADERR